MKQKTIGINPLEEYLSGKKQAKEQQESRDEAASKEMELVATSKPVAMQVVPDSVKEQSIASESAAQRTQSADEEIDREEQATKSTLFVAQETVSLETPLHLDSSLSGQLTINESLTGRTNLAGKQRITLHISAEIVDRVKNAVYWEPGLTVAGFAEEALEKALADMEAERGKPFPQRRQHRLRGGRPII